MSFQVKNTFTRPSTGVVFHISNVPDTFITHVLENYKNVGKLLDIVTEVTPDGKTLVSTWTWASESEYNAYFNDPATVEFRTARDAHNEANGITNTLETTTL